MYTKDAEAKTNHTVYVSDKIGDEYWKWHNSDIIFITTGTGTGKSYFVLHNLVKRAVEKGERILYLVNRKILKKQLEAERDRVNGEITDRYNAPIPLRNFVHFLTYQTIEAYLKNMYPWQVRDYMLQMREKYNIVVYDECHYFYSDSNFNTSTELSYDFFRCCFDINIQIFMSATMENMDIMIKERIPFFQQPFISGRVTYNTTLKPSLRYKYYSCDTDYSYINLEVFLNYSDIISVMLDRIRDCKEKWLVFVNNIDYGKRLKKDLINKADSCIDEEDVVFIDAEYNQDAEAQASVSQLTQQNQIKNLIVITTPVMDNGISFHDMDLRNIVILTDTKEEFIQMLGRKRRDENKVNVFICQQSRIYFQRRLQSVEKKLKVYNDYSAELYNRFYFVDNIRKIRCNGPFSYYLNFCDVNNNYQQRILDSIIQNEASYQGVLSFGYIYQGTIAYNSFSVNRLLNLRNFYEEMIKELETDNTAFIKKQAQWLGFSVDDIQEVSVKSRQEIIERIRKQICQNIEQYTDKELTVADNIEMKMLIRDALKELLIDIPTFEESEITNITKTGRTISEKQFNKSMEIIGLPYRMSKPTKSSFLIKIDEE